LQKPRRGRINRFLNALGLVKTGDHRELKVNVADWSEKSGTFVWKTLKKRATTLAEAKELAANFAEIHPHVFESKE